MQKLIEIRFHGRAGQGIVTAANLLALAAAKEGKFVQAFPFFGSEKRGPPVTSYCRISTEKIELNEEIEAPDIVVVADSSILNEVDVTEGTKNESIIIINSKKEIKLNKKCKTFFVDGTEIAVKNLGKPITNTVMLGALAKITSIVKLESIEKAIKERFKEELAEKNIQAIKECFNEVD